MVGRRVIGVAFHLERGVIDPEPSGEHGLQLVRFVLRVVDGNASS